MYCRETLESRESSTRAGSVRHQNNKFKKVIVSGNIIAGFWKQAKTQLLPEEHKGEEKQHEK